MNLSQPKMYMVQSIKRWDWELGMAPDPTRPGETFFDPKGKKLKNLGFLGEIFWTQTKDGWPDPSNKKLTQPDPGQKILTRTHHNWEPFFFLIEKNNFFMQYYFAGCFPQFHNNEASSNALKKRLIFDNNVKSCFTPQSIHSVPAKYLQWVVSHPGSTFFVVSSQVAFDLNNNKGILKLSWVKFLYRNCPTNRNSV